MAKFFTGRDGRLVIDGTEQIKVSSWNLTGALETLETTTLGDKQRSYTPGVQEFSGQATLLYYTDTANRNDAASALKRVLNTQGVESSDTVDLRLRLVEGNTNRDVRLNAYITNVSYGADVGGVTSADITFQGTGALTEVTI